ncbi:hypothetical protein ABFS82_10G007000 [Erythranthe guttata]|uniref:uncharacterized protein LOC105953159 n=1 Tax=Erythranthe guttata TaxID=4155 RepID=UPI00064DA260|nr:PREDICTED: uncharacterized protein LOC105953159 [Erythranthe guttata]|eukprot:XP_012832247.1 PREDICTED: uncharacterized protein LOC105953159 [Erythranthe guttata]
MQFGLYRTTPLAAAARLSSVLGKMTTNRGMKSSPDARKSLTDNERGQPSILNMEEFPSLSATKSIPYRKRRNKIDLITTSERRTEAVVVQNIGPLHGEASTSINDSYDTSLPANFGKKTPPSFCRKPKPGQNYQEHEVSTSINDSYDTSLPADFGKKATPSSFTRKPKPRQNYHEHEASKRNSNFSRGTDVDEPFDICFTEPRKSSHRRNSSHDKNSGKWVQKVQSSEENVHLEDITEKIDDVEYSVIERGEVLRPGMVLFKSYIPISEQVAIVKRCQEFGRGPGGFYRPGYEDGAKLRLYMMCLGLDWNAQSRKYGDIRQHDNVKPPHIPDEFTSLVTKALDDSHTLIKQNFPTENVEDVLPKMSPDVCIVNFYNTNGRLGLHQDRDESKCSLRKRLPVVSISVGDSAEFLYGDERDADVADRVLLESGDVVIFGGESRHVFHGVKSIIPNSAPRELLENTNLRPGRLNLTFRKY